jgi:hypothetical protein
MVPAESYGLHRLAGTTCATIYTTWIWYRLIGEALADSIELHQSVGTTSVTFFTTWMWYRPTATNFADRPVPLL